MTASFTKIGPDALTRFTQGDERALEQIFRDEYDSLVALATAEVGEPGPAPMLVESAFYEAWQKRATFTSPGDLEYFLRRCIHQGALREQGRRAALHRFAEHEGRHAAQGNAAPARTPTADEAWAQLALALHAPPRDEERAAHIRHDHSRHEAAAHVAHIAEHRTPKSTIALMIGVSAAVIVAIVLLVRALAPGDPVASADAALAMNETRLVSTRPGLRANVELADGSRASLGPDTRLRIPPGFGERTRSLGVEGTASFQVAPENSRSFVVRAGSATVLATGTAFDVSAFPGTNVIVRVREGTVDVLAGGTRRALREGEAVMADAAGALSQPTAAALDEALGWTDGHFVVSDRSMREMPALLQRWYGMQVLVGDSSVLERRVSFRVPLDSSRQLMHAIQTAGQVRYTSRGDTRLFRDAQQ